MAKKKAPAMHRMPDGTMMSDAEMRRMMKQRTKAKPKKRKARY